MVFYILKINICQYIIIHYAMLCEIINIQLFPYPMASFWLKTVNFLVDV